MNLGGLPSTVRVRRTIERAARLIPARRIVAVVMRSELARYERLITALAGPRVIAQPWWCGSAVELVLAALRVHREDPHATLAVLPADHVVDHEARFMHYVARAAAAVGVRPDVPVVIGAYPRRLDDRYAWIDPGEPVEGLEQFAIQVVRRMVRAPSATEMRTLFDGHGLLSTLVLVVRGTTLLDIARSTVPDVLEALEPLVDVFGSPEERLLADAVYESMPSGSLDREILEGGRPFAVLPIPDVMWTASSEPALPLAS